MRKTVAATLLLVAAPSVSMAGEMYGTIGPQGWNLEVRVLCADRAQNAFTDQRGFYRLYVPQQGECRLSVRRGGGEWTSDLTIYSSDKPVRYDLVIKGRNLERQ